MPTSLFPRLGERRAQGAGTLSGGEQRMLSLARVLVNPPRLLVVDELSLGLAPIIIDELYTTLRRVNEAGTALLIIEQYVGRALSIAQSAVILQHGEVIYDGSVADLGDVSERLLAKESSATGARGDLTCPSRTSRGTELPDEVQRGEDDMTLFNAFRYDGKRVLVVGGATGMGAAVGGARAGRRGRGRGDGLRRGHAARREGDSRQPRRRRRRSTPRSTSAADPCTRCSRAQVLPTAPPASRRSTSSGTGT